MLSTKLEVCTTDVPTGKILPEVLTVYEPRLKANVRSMKPRLTAIFSQYEPSICLVNDLFIFPFVHIFAFSEGFSLSSGDLACEAGLI